MTFLLDPQLFVRKQLPHSPEQSGILLFHTFKRLKGERSGVSVCPARSQQAVHGNPKAHDSAPPKQGPHAFSFWTQFTV
jgi:hypothetical protein